MTDAARSAYPAPMTEDPIQPVEIETVAHVAKGRPADLLATMIAALGTILSVIGAIWFFAGFAENDTRPEHLVSAFVLTVGLFILAIAPFASVAGFARRAYRVGGRRAHYLWTLFLMVPWVGLGILSLTYTPLPVWAGLIATALSVLLVVWASVSLIIDSLIARRARI